MKESRRVLRQASIATFFFAALFALFLAGLNEAEEAYITWTHPKPLGLLVFSGASLVAAGLALGRQRSVGARYAGVLLLAPAVLMLGAANSTASDAKWLLIAGSGVIVVVGGLVAGGLPRKD